MCRSSRSWIGLYKYSASSVDPSPSHQYWLDGSTSTFRRWKWGRPDETDTPCITMYDDYENGEFNDAQCYYEYSFVCKKTGGV